MGRSRGGLTSKIHAVVDTKGLPVRLALTAGEAHDNRLVLTLLSSLKSGAMLLADRGYDADWIRTLASQKGASANIPPKKNRKEPLCFSPHQNTECETNVRFTPEKRTFVGAAMSAFDPKRTLG